MSCFGVLGGCPLEILGWPHIVLLVFFGGPLARLGIICVVLARLLRLLRGPLEFSGFLGGSTGDAQEISGVLGEVLGYPGLARGAVRLLSEIS